MRAVLVLCVLVVACSGGSDGGMSTSSSSAGGVTANCADGDSSLVEGTLDGKPVNVMGTTRGWSWLNFGNPSKFDGRFDGGAVHLEWASTTPNKAVTTVTAATLTLDANAGARTFQSGSLVYDSPDPEKILKATLTFDTGSVTVCMRQTD
jgi:hypothetical protein